MIPIIRRPEPASFVSDDELITFPFRGRGGQRVDPARPEPESCDEVPERPSFDQVFMWTAGGCPSARRPIEHCRPTD